MLETHGNVFDILIQIQIKVNGVVAQNRMLSQAKGKHKWYGSCI